MDKRNHMGKATDEVIIPVAPIISEMSDTYLSFIDNIKNEIKKQRLSVVLSANASMICLYWNIGKAILNKQAEEGWGSKVIDRISKDINDAFPDMSGFSPRNIKYMRKFAEVWNDYEIMQRMGYNESMIKKSVRRQVQTYYIIPYVIGLLHSIFAITCYKSALMDDLLGKSSAVLVPVLFSIAVFSAIYAIYYQLTKHSCYKIALN